MKLSFLFLFFLLAACTPGRVTNVQASLTDFFEPLNWQVIHNRDTFYIFFSPINDSLVETYEYKIINGDSVNTQQNAIKYFDDTLKWQFNEYYYTISQIEKNKISLALNNEIYYLNKISDSLMVVEGFDDSLYFKRTLPLSTFLVRKKYDFVNGTSGTDSAETEPRKIREYNLQ
jgi:hypothetical protein